VKIRTIAKQAASAEAGIPNGFDTGVVYATPQVALACSLISGCSAINLRIQQAPIGAASSWRSSNAPSIRGLGAQFPSKCLGVHAILARRGMKRLPRAEWPRGKTLVKQGGSSDTAHASRLSEAIPPGHGAC